MMIAYICYEKTPAGKIQLLPAQGHGALVDTLAVKAGDGGRYEVQGKGALPEVSAHLLLPVKGSMGTSLKLQVLAVKSLINPPGAWQASCQGPDVREFSLRRLDVSCDECHVASQLEFVEYSQQRQQDAITALQMQGWQADSERQVCPSCLRKKAPPTQPIQKKPE
ncbi:MAG: hypothetical protein RPR40_11090 [Bermanella sp.]